MKLAERGAPGRSPLSDARSTWRRDQLDPRQPVLIMIQGPEPGSLYKLPDNRVTTIGRSSRSTIRVVTSTVSRFHCEIACINGSWELSDLNSRRGTMVNGERIADKRVLSPGDLVRLSTTVFRFDLLEETAERDSALMAVNEPGTEQKLTAEGQAAGPLDDIRLRSRLEREEARQNRARARHALKVNLAFLGVVAVATAIVVGALLFWAHWPAEVQRDFAGATAVPQAAQTQADTVWTAVQEKLSAVAAREADNDYAAALGLYEELEKLEPSEPAGDLLRQRRQCTVRLAHASFRTVEEAAARLARNGDREAALELYRRALDRIGVPELAAQARARIAELQTETAG